MRVVHIELHRVEEVLHSGGGGNVAVDEVLVAAADDNLASDGDLLHVAVADWRLRLVAVIECDAHAGLDDACLALLVDELLKVARSNLGSDRPIHQARV